MQRVLERVIDQASEVIHRPMAVSAEHPVYWQLEDNGRWLRRNFDQWIAPG